MLSFKDLLAALQGSTIAINGSVVDKTIALSIQIGKLKEQAPPDQQAEFQSVLDAIAKLQSDVVTSVQSMNPIQSTPVEAAPVVVELPPAPKSEADVVVVPPALEAGPSLEDIIDASLDIELPLEIEATPSGIGVDGAISIELSI